MQYELSTGKRRRGALRVHPHKHYANFSPQKDRGFASGSREWICGAKSREREEHEAVCRMSDLSRRRLARS